MTLVDRNAPLKRLARTIAPFRTPQMEDALREYPQREIVTGLVVSGVFLATLFGWGLWARLDAAVTATGQVVVSGERQSVQHKDGGIVAELDVREGDRVKAGQVLLRLNADELRASERAFAAQVLELKALQARLTAELNDRPTITFPSELTSATGLDQADAQSAMALQRREFDARNAALGTQKQVLGEHQKETVQQIDGYRRQVASSREQQRLIQEEIDGLKTLQARGLVPATRVRSLQRNAAELSGGEGEYSADIAKSEVEIGESRIRISDLERERAADDNKDYQTAEFQLADLQPKLAALQGQIDRTVVRAPATGRIVGLSIFTVGGVVAPGQKLMDVVPESQPLVIEAKVKPGDASDLRIGEKVQVRISAFHDRGMPLLNSVISKVSADSFTDDKTGKSYFQIEAVVPPSELKVIRDVRGADVGLRPGLPVDLVVPLRARSALQYLTEPLHQILWKSFREQ